MRLGVVAILALALAVGLAAGVSPFASPSPDGLERVAADHGFAQDGRLHALQEQAPAPDYAFPGLEDGGAATAAAGLAGTLLVFGLGAAFAVAVRRRRTALPPA